MSLVIDSKNELKEFREKRPQPVFLRIIAKIISYIFHPLFIPVYLSWLLLRTKPYFFSSLNETDQRMYLPRFAIMYVMFPLISVLLLKGLKFIDSIYLRTQRERVIPYIVCMIYYWWMWYVLRTQDIFPKESIILSFAIFLASVGGLMANIYMKVSMHTIACGIMIAFVALLSFTSDISAGIDLSVAFLLTGIICTARFIDSDHTPREIYGGLVIGILSLVAAVLFA